jgi:putative transposase
MADENDVVPADVGSDTEANVKEAPEPKPNKTRTKKTDKVIVQSAVKKDEATTLTAGPKRSKAADGANQVAEVEKLVAQGTSLKDAFEQVGVSKQSYYRWKRLAGSEQMPSSAPAYEKAAPQVSAGDAFADLLELEAENERLRKLLADKLRSENADLRKRLGLD